MSDIFDAVNSSDILGIALLLPTQWHRKDSMGSSIIRHMDDERMFIFINMAIDLGLDINEKDFCGWSALHYAAYNADISKSKYLISLGADKCILTEEGNNLMMTSLSHSYPNLDLLYAFLTYLIEEGIDINHQNDAGATPLIIAGILCKEAIDFLICNGANPEIENGYGKSYKDYLT